MSKASFSRISIVLFLATSCTYDHFNATPSLCADVTISLGVSVTNVTTCGASDGTITVAPEGGVRIYTFSMDGVTYQTDSVFSSLKAGSYTVSVRDKNGCSGSQIASVNNAQSPIQLSTTATANSGCPTPNGTITVTVTGAINPVQYKLNTGAYQSNNIFTALKAGTYSITVLDASGCPDSGSAVVTSNGPSFKTDVSPIIISYCGGCHGSNGRSPILSSYATISANGSSVVGSINGNMPPDGKLSAQQINQITCWVQDGSLNN